MKSRAGRFWLAVAGLFGVSIDPLKGHPMSSKFRFEHRLIDRELTGGSWGQTTLADYDGDGLPEFTVGQNGGPIYWYDYADGGWKRYLLGERSPSDVGACALDVDGDGHLDFVTGGAWYRNPGDPRSGPFERIVFDPDLNSVHDILAADIDGDGKPEVLTMSDRNNLRWHKIPDDPRQRWIRHDIAGAVHAGLAVGDLDGDGDLDIARSNVWLENVRGDGSEWIEHPIGSFGGKDGWTKDATRVVVCDMNRDGANDLVIAEAEIVGARIFWMENLDGKGRQWKRHALPHGDDDPRGAYHSLYVGDLDGDGDLDIFSCEMEWVKGPRSPRWFIWENLDGKGGEFAEHIIFDAGLGGHEAVVGDADGDGKLDILSKPWTAWKDNALSGRMHVDWLRGLSDFRRR